MRRKLVVVLMIIGAMNNPKNDLASEIEAFGEMGFDYFEITVESPSATPEKIAANRKKIMDALHSYNLGVLSHYPWYFSVAHPYENIQKAINAEFGKAFESAASLGAKLATIHTEFMPPSVQEKPVQVARTVASIKALHKIASDVGLELLIENYGASSFAIKDFKSLFSELDMRMTLDVGHAEVSGGEGMDGYVSNFKKRIAHVHLHDNNRMVDQHLPLGAGKIDIEKCVKDLKSFYDGTITLEVHSSDRDFMQMGREKLEILWFGRKKFEENKDYLQPQQNR
jgi:sugar phosphate isomerase/epimerase